MNLNQIQYMLAIHQYGSITQAAEKLFVSAPSISIAIKNLEEELGCALLIRHHNGVTFTEEGEEALHLMNEIEENIKKLHHLDQNFSTSGEITIGVSLHTKASLFLPTLIRLQSTYPDIIVNGTDEKSSDIVRNVAQGQHDLGLIHYSDIDAAYFTKTIERYNLIFSKLFEGNMLFVVHENHPLTKQPIISIKDVLQYPFLNYYKTDFTKAHHRSLLQENPNYHLIQTDDRDMYRDLLHNSNAVTLMPSLNEICNIKQFTGLTFLHVSDFSHPYIIGWIHSDTSLTRIEKIIVNYLSKEIEQYRAQ
ncbi:MAG: LysR family transcriptional regulator [Peptococcaceae bacterium]|nr:LysR family transcriptional regulator [Peptococcaceae bacterium]